MPWKHGSLGVAFTAFGACSGGGAGAGACSSSDGTTVGVGGDVGGISSDVGVGTSVATGFSLSELIGGDGGIFSGVGVGIAVATGTSLSATFLGSGLAVLAWKLVPFPDFLGRFASWQAASGISECSVAASPLLEFSLARASNRRIMECSVAASGIAVSFSLAASGISECSVAASGIAVLTDPRIADDDALRDEPGHSWGS